VPNRDREGPIHRAVIDFLRLSLPGAVVHHSANEIGLQGLDVARQIAKAKWNGMLPGWPDIEVFHAGRVLLIEVKAPGNGLTPAQAECHERLRDQGFAVHVVRSLDDARGVIEGMKS